MTAIPAGTRTAAETGQAGGESGWPGAQATAAFAVPLALLAAAGSRAGFLSEENLLPLARGLLAHGHGRADLLALIYPPLPVGLMLLCPSAALAAMIGVLSGAATLGLLWRQLRRSSMPYLLVWTLMLGTMATPSLLYTFTQSLPDALALLCLAVALDAFRRFMEDAATGPGFTCGMALGLALLSHHLALPAALLCASLAGLVTGVRQPGFNRATAIVVVFPSLFVAGSWLYVCWMFLPSMWQSLADPAASPLQYLRPDAWTGPVGITQTLVATLRDVATAPLAWGCVAAILLEAPRRIVLPALAFASIALARALGLVVTPTLAIGLTIVGALTAIPRAPSARLCVLLVVAAVVHAAVQPGLGWPPGTAAWRSALTGTALDPQTQEDQAIAAVLRRLPDRSVLLDERLARRLLVRTGTAAPFVTSADPTFPLAESAPRDFVTYIFAPASRRDGFPGRIAATYPGTPPLGFRVAGRWPHWQLLEREDGPDLGLAGVAR